MKNYKIISLLFIIIFLLSSCDKATKNNKDTNKNAIIPSNFIYTPFSGSTKIDEILNNNVIDKRYIEEWKDVVTTVDTVNIYQKYLDIWQNELDIVVKKIEKNISDDELNEFRNSQEAWVAFYETNPNIAVDIYSDRMGTGTIIHEIYGNKALFMKRYRVLELAEYCYLLTGNFEFNFNP